MRPIPVLLCLLCFICAQTNQEKPVLYLIGDSTVKNGGGRGADGLWGWGDFLAPHFDTTRITIENHARGGRSSRTYQTEGLWDNVLAKVKPGDYVMLQFGHNDGGPLNDTLRARGSIRGTGEETEVIDNLITKKTETVHTYGWYIRKYIQDTKAKGATPIVCSLVARNIWKDGKVERATASYRQWAEAAAKAEGAFFIDLNDRVASQYEKLGPDEVKSKLFLKDHTHTTEEGARINAAIVATALKEAAGFPLAGFLRK
ncbi:rhamnogalacturonan acetylesterase [Fulvivirgaceae bacterium PWU4]|uniref:Rhamnogalacturonan acetylesterase n=1 Tax=Chryseosolibacter histidini TaxID=2782349 RepID=A0AAP2GQJ5_9BACT|nr:rhamnogalacturonan acetylesterase [Chryseosolibacter histidini]MBT1698995.1 rhamnogalacturonan acetylesterase [Chryseosolibacter histidini]